MSAEGRAVPDEIRIANAATYWPVAPTDVVLAVPLAARLLLGATPIGRIVQAAAFGAYAASALQDWAARRWVRKIDFHREFGADVRHLTPMDRETRAQEVDVLIGRLNDGFTAERIPRRELAVEVNRHLTNYITGSRGQRVETSTEVRSFSMAGLFFPSRSVPATSCRGTSPFFAMSGGQARDPLPGWPPRVQPVRAAGISRLSGLQPVDRSQLQGASGPYHVCRHHGKRDTVTRYGFLVEHVNAVAARNRWQALRVSEVPPQIADPETLALVEVFQYMIGNPDWALFSKEPGEETCCHNTVPIGASGGPVLFGSV